MIYKCPLQLIGNTPLLKLKKLIKKNCANLYVKLEMYNYTGSVKDRSALGMIEAAEKEGLLKSNSILVESSSGNLGVSLAAIANLKGYKFICVLDPKAETEKINTLKAFGASIVMVNKPDKDGGYQKPRIARVEKLIKEIPNAINLNQYNNPNNPQYNYETTGPEIYKDLKGKIDVLIGAVSTGGHLCGTARYLKEKNPNIYVIGVEPEGSSIFGGEFKPYLQQGTGLSFKPQNYDSKIIDEKIKVSDKNAFLTTRKIAKKEGVLIGGSSGGAIYIALKKARNLTPDKNIVTILPDHGEKYLTTVFSDKWLKEKGIK